MLYGSRNLISGCWIYKAEEDYRADIDARADNVNDPFLKDNVCFKCSAMRR